MTLVVVGAVVLLIALAEAIIALSVADPSENALGGGMAFMAGFAAVIAVAVGLIILRFRVDDRFTRWSLIFGAVIGLVFAVQTVVLLGAGILEE